MLKKFTGPYGGKWELQNIWEEWVQVKGPTKPVPRTGKGKDKGEVGAGKKKVLDNDKAGHKSLGKGKGVTSKDKGVSSKGQAGTRKQGVTKKLK